MHNRGNRVLTNDCVLKGNILYFFAYNLNALCAFNIDNDSVEVLWSIPNESFFGDQLISAIIAYGSKLIMAPMRCNKNVIWTYDLQTKETEEIPIGDCSVKPPFEKYSAAFLYKHEIILIGCYIPEIVIFDIEKKTFKHIVVDNGEKDLFFLGGYERIGDTLYVPSSKDNYVLQIDLLSKHYSLKRIGNKGNRYAGIEKYGDGFLLIPTHQNYLIEWDGEDGYKLNEMLKGLFDNGTVHIFGSITIGNKILISGTWKYKSVWLEIDNLSKYEIDEDTYLMLKTLDDGCRVLASSCGRIRIYAEKMFEGYLPNKKDVIKSMLKIYKKCDAYSVNIGIVEEDLETNLESFVESIDG